jgi:CO/xanthine dehydrogenase FAD-binding subunit
VEDDELVTAVRVPAVLSGSGFAYHKVVRANADYSTVTVAAYMEADGSKAKVVRVAIGGDRIPARLKSIESALQGNPAGADAFKDAVNAGVSGMKWFDAWGLTKDFIRNLATVHLNDVLAEAWARAKGGRS